MQLDINELRELLSTLDQTSISELILKGVDFELTVRKGTGVESIRIPGGSTDALASFPSVDATIGTTANVAPTTAPSPTPEVAKPTPSPPPPLSTGVDPKWVEVTSPMVGTFYRSPGPDEKPFVEVNDRIGIGQTVCIIEAMKLMNEIEAEISGQVMQILVQNGQPVEYGQRLMLINPN